MNGSMAIGSRRTSPTSPLAAAVVSEPSVAPRYTPWTQLKAWNTSGTVRERRPPKMLAETRTPSGSFAAGSSAGLLVIGDGGERPALLLVLLRGNEHGKVGLAAGAGEGGSDVALLALRGGSAHEQHVLGHPTLLLAEEAGDAQGETLLAEQGVAAVAG